MQNRYQAALAEKARKVTAAVVPHDEQLIRDLPKHLATISKVEAHMKEAYRLLHEAEVTLDGMLSHSSVGLDKECSAAVEKASETMGKVWAGLLYPKDFNHLRDVFQKKAR